MCEKYDLKHKTAKSAKNKRTLFCFNLSNGGILTEFFIVVFFSGVKCSQWICFMPGLRKKEL